MATNTGLIRIIEQADLQKKIKGNVGLLLHGASVDQNYQIAVLPLQKILGPRLKKLFGPQHGLWTDVQDNMIETQDFVHPYFKLKVHSLYSHTRIPTDQMLEGLDTILVDLQDVGTRIYTYIYTLTLLMEACGKKGIKVMVLDRPNPVGGLHLEGNVLEEGFTSFVGRHPLPVRHGLTIGEVAILAKKHFQAECELEVVAMENWQRHQYFEQTGLPWVIPSPNLPTVESAFTFVGTVLFEGTNISEGRGTTRSLELVAHPKLEPYGLLDKINSVLQKASLDGQILRPCVVVPTFNKHQGKASGGLQIHVTDREKFRPWRLCQILCKLLYQELGEHFAWKAPPYEYEYEKMPVDLINGTDALRKWVEKPGLDLDFLDEIEAKTLPIFLNLREGCLLYK